MEFIAMILIFGITFKLLWPWFMILILCFKELALLTVVSVLYLTGFKQTAKKFISIQSPSHSIAWGYQHV